MKSRKRFAGDLRNFYSSERVAAGYDEARFSGVGGHYVDTIEQAAIKHGLPEAASGPILEIGCGTGRCTESLLRDGYSVTALDPSGSMLDRAKERLAVLPAEVRERSQLLVGDGFELDTIAGPFAAAVSLRVFIHLRVPEAEAMMRQVHEKLVPEGVFCFDTLNPWSPNVVIRPLNLLGGSYSKNAFPSPRKLRSSAERCGFEVEDVVGRFVIPQFIFRMSKRRVTRLAAVNRRLEQLFPRLSGHLFWVLRKKG